MNVYTTEYAAEHLAELLDLLAQGESVLISKDGRPVARMLPIVDDDAAEVPTVEVEEAFHGD